MKIFILVLGMVCLNAFAESQECQTTDLNEDIKAINMNNNLSTASKAELIYISKLSLQMEIITCMSDSNTHLTKYQYELMMELMGIQYKEKLRELEDIRNYLISQLQNSSDISEILELNGSLAENKENIDLLLLEYNKSVEEIESRWK